MPGSIALGAALKSCVEPYHRCVILSDVKTDADTVVLVRITSASSWSDKSCILEKADWPELDHQSVVAFETARTGAVKAALEAQINAGGFKVIPSPPLATLKKIIAAARLSPRTPPEAKAALASIP